MGCPQNCGLGCLAMANFRFQTVGRNLGPDRTKLGQLPHLRGKNRTTNDKKAARRLPKWIRSMNGVTEPRWCSSLLSRWVLFWDILGCFRPFWAQAGPNRNHPIWARRGAMQAENAHWGVLSDPDPQGETP